MTWLTQGNGRPRGKPQFLTLNTNMTHPSREFSGVLQHTESKRIVSRPPTRWPLKKSLCLTGQVEAMLKLSSW